MAGSIYSLVINWCDGDREQGNYGWMGRAANEEEAEDKARRDMWAQDNDPDEYDDSDPPYGSVVDSEIGASWMANEMEAALRGLLSDDIATVEAARESGAKLVAELDAL